MTQAFIRGGLGELVMKKLVIPIGGVSSSIELAWSLSVRQKLRAHMILVRQIRLHAQIDASKGGYPLV